MLHMLGGRWSALPGDEANGVSRVNVDKDRQKDVQTGNKERKAVSMENMDEEGRKDALTGDE